MLLPEQAEPSRPTGESEAEYISSLKQHASLAHPPSTLSKLGLFLPEISVPQSARQRVHHRTAQDHLQED